MLQQGGFQENERPRPKGAVTDGWFSTVLLYMRHAHFPPLLPSLLLTAGFSRSADWSLAFVGVCFFYFAFRGVTKPDGSSVVPEQPCRASADVNSSWQGHVTGRPPRRGWAGTWLIRPDIFLIEDSGPSTVSTSAKTHAHAASVHKCINICATYTFPSLLLAAGPFFFFLVNSGIPILPRPPPPSFFQVSISDAGGQWCSFSCFISLGLSPFACLTLKTMRRMSFYNLLLLIAGTLYDPHRVSPKM